MPSGVRLVPMSRAQRDALDSLAGYLESTTDRKGVMWIVAAYDAAPADPTEAIYEALDTCLQRNMQVGLVDPILRALGWEAS